MDMVHGTWTWYKSHLGCHGTRYAVGTARPRLVRVRRYVQYVEPRGKLPCASGPYSPYVRYGGPGTYVSAQAATVYVVSSCSSRVRVRVAAGGGA